MTKAEAIAECVSVILTTRDFCGDEMLAAFELLGEYGFRSERDEMYRAALAEANAEWRKFQAAAGVPRKYWK